MKKTTVGEIPEAEDAEGKNVDTSKQHEKKSVDTETDKSRTNDLTEESLAPENTLSDPNNEGSDKVPQKPSSDCTETDKSKSSIEEKEKESTMEVENVSPEPERRSSRLRGKRAKLTEITTTSDEEEFETDDDTYERKEKDRKRGKKSILAKYIQKTQPRGNQKKTTEKKTSESEPRKKDTVKEARIPHKSEDINKEFTSGSFVVLKSDFHSTTTPPIWKIDGKALLQKYTHFEQEGQTLYKNTSTYSGWIPNNKDQYYPAPVELKSQTRQETIVRFNREAINAEDSD